MSWLQTAQGIITLISTGAVLLSTLIGVSIKLYKALKEIIKNKEWTKIIDIADDAIAAAEESGKSGADKKKMAMDAVEAACASLGIVVDLEKVSNYIDECIEFANKLNKK